MSNDISAIGQASPPPRAPAPAVAAPVPAAAPAAPAAPAAAAPAAEAKAPKPEAKPFEPTLDVEEMRANLREDIERLNDMMRDNGRNLNFSMDEASDRVVITVKNTETGEIVRQIPDATMLRVSHNLENVKGMLHNEST